MAGPPNTRIKTPLAQRILDFKHRTLPLVIWSVAALIVVVMLVQRTGNYEYIGLAQSFEYEISAEANGTVEALVVGLFDEVDPGEAVATLDDSQVVASLRTADAEISRLRADLEAARAGMLTQQGQDVSDWSADLRRFQLDIERRRLDALSLKVVIESDEVELERRRLEMGRSDALLGAGIIGEALNDEVRLRFEEVRKRIEKNMVLLAQNDEELRAAEGRRAEFQANLPEIADEEPLLQPFQVAIEVQSRRLAEIEVQRGALVLRSPVAGQVSQILCRKGQAVIPGEPVVTVAERTVSEIVAYLGETEAVQFDDNAPVLVASSRRPGVVAESVVLRVSPSVQPLPQRLWRDPQVADYGRAVVIAATPSMTLVPGELVRVRFLD